MVPEAGIEPTTFSLEGCCSIQLSYPGWVVEVYFSPHCLGVYRLSHIMKCSTIGTTWLDFCVRDGNRYTSRVLNTKTVNRKMCNKRNGR